MHSEGEDTMASAARVVHPVTSHHFVLETLPEVPKSIFNSRAFEAEEIIYRNIIGTVPSQLKARHAIKALILRLIEVRVQQIIDLLIVQLNVGTTNSYLRTGIILFLQMNLSEEISNSSWYHTFILIWLLYLVLRYQRYNLIRSIGVSSPILIALHRVGFPTSCLAIHE
jgi:hypothetical protein